MTTTPPPAGFTPKMYRDPADALFGLIHACMRLSEAGVYLADPTILAMLEFRIREAFLQAYPDVAALAKAGGGA